MFIYSPSLARSLLLETKKLFKNASKYFHFTLIKECANALWFSFFSSGSPPLRLVTSFLFRSIKSQAQIEIENGLSLRGDVLVKCFEKRSSSERSLVFQCQFNTCALDLDPRNPVLHFYREELDLVTTERNVDNQALIQFSFVLEPPKESPKKPKSSRRSLSLSSARESRERDPSVSRADSYENFDRPEGEFSSVTNTKLSWVIKRSCS